jgi:NCS1 family nucleobase:cation symporter-1
MSTSTPAAPKALTTIEQRGIEPVPDAERNGNPLQLFWVWFASNISILGLPLGATLVALQTLNIWQSVMVAVIGAAGSFALVGIVSIAGRRGGAPSMTLSRSVFGTRGNLGPTFVSLLSRLGWETVNTTTGAFVLLSLATILLGTSGDAKTVPVVTLVAIAIFEVCTVLVSGLGHAAILVIQRWATWIFGALNVFVAVFLVATINWDAVAAIPAGPFTAVLVGIGVIAGGTGIGWANAGADMARYQRTSVKAGRLITASAAGAGIPLVLLIGLGALLTAGDSSLASASDPVGAIRELLPTWMAVPYLIAAFGGLLLSNHLSVYSAGLTTLTMGVKIKRVYAVGLDVIVTFIGSIYFMLVADSFYGPFIALISLLAIPITAWLGVFLVDMIKRHWYDPEALMILGRESRYFYRGGFEWRAVASWAVGIVVGYVLLANGISGWGWIATFVVSAVIYLALGGARGVVNAPAASTSDALAEVANHG